VSRDDVDCQRRRDHDRRQALLDRVAEQLDEQDEADDVRAAEPKTLLADCGECDAIMRIEPCF